MADRDRAVLDEGDGDRRAHARAGGVLGRRPVHAPVRLLDQLRHLLLAASGASALLERGGREPRRDLARLRSAHPVGDSEQRRLYDVGVLVPSALPAGVRPARYPPHDHASNRRSVSPMRTTSPSFSRLGPSSRTPLT